ncbi:hypothetical protein EPO04_03495 [Patescibacteria group bacterium]|nr:MAG: hypothetical protein EPO04_03495 [Patescibacteria group bacterium]
MQITDLAAKLQSLGLADKEARVYVAALFLGPSSVQKIASHADVNRATAYVILDQLADYGLISQSQEKNKTVFVAEPPEALEALFARQQQEIEERKQELKRILPDLEMSARGNSASGAPVVRFYKGQEALTNINLQMLKKTKPNSTLYAFANYDEIMRLVPSEIKTTPGARLKKNIGSRLFYSSSGEIPSDPKLLRETKKLDKPVAADVMFYEGMAVMQSYPDNPSDTVGIIIESPEIVAALRQIFELAWDNCSSK